MRSEWTPRKVADLQAEGVLRVEDGNHGEYRPRPDEFTFNGTAFIRAANVVDGSVDFEGAGGINETALARIRKGVGEPGDILLTHKGTVGRVGRVPPDAPAFVCSPQTTFWRVLDESQVDRRYLFAYLRSPAFAEQLYARMHGSDMAPYVSLTDQKGLSLELPPLEEQHAIGGVLAVLDDKLQNNRRICKLLEDIATTLFRARFVDFVDHEDLVESEIGAIPRGWEVEPVGEAVKVVGGSTPSTKVPFFWGDEHHWATPKDLSKLDHPILLDTARRITDAGVERISSGLLPRKTVLMSSRAPVGYTAISWVPVAVNQGFIAIPPSDRVPSEYVLFWLREKMDLIKSNAGGTTFAEISKRAFRPLPMLVPPEDVLAEFARSTRPLVDCIAACVVENVSLASLRDTLLPKLVSGALRVDPDVYERDGG
jgi:type I restriction enzyme, S subunit